MQRNEREEKRREEKRNRTVSCKTGEKNGGSSLNVFVLVLFEEGDEFVDTCVAD